MGDASEPPLPRALGVTWRNMAKSFLSSATSSWMGMLVGPYGYALIIISDGTLTGLSGSAYDLKLRSRTTTFGSCAPPLSSSSRSVYASANAFKVARHVAEREGAKALFSGATARVLFHVPAAAICWTAYEFMKRNLGIEVDPSSAH